MSDPERKPLDEACAQLLSLVRMMGVAYIDVSVSAAGRVTMFASDSTDPNEEEPPWTVTAQVGPTDDPDWQDAPGPTDAIRESSKEIAELSRKRHGLLTPTERRAKMRIVR